MEAERRSIQSFCPRPPSSLHLKVSRNQSQRMANGSCNSNTDTWDQLFHDGYRADVCVVTNGGNIPAHANILGVASPVMRSMLKQAKRRGCGGSRRSISICGVPHHAVRVFLRFIYSSRYEDKEMNQFVLHLLVLAHVFVIPTLKRVCIEQLEGGLLSTDNVVDAFQLSGLCDAPRLSLLCHRLIQKRFNDVYSSSGWKILRKSNPKLEKEILDSLVDADARKMQRLRRLEERKIYLQLHEAMEALVHICKDGCRTIGPHDKVLKQNAEPCNFPACKGLEALVRHFAGCKNRVVGGCTHCKRMWQLLELHSRLCIEEEVGCKVPLCRQFKKKLRNQSKKDEVKWKLLASKVMEVERLSLPRKQSSVLLLCS